MTLYLTEDQVALHEMAERAVATEAPVAHLRALRDADDAAGYSPALWKQFAELGFNGILVPEAQGGLGLGYVEAGIVAQEIGRNLTPSPFVTSGMAAVAAFNAAGGANADEWLPRIAAGEAVVALAFDEGGKHRPDAIGTTLQPTGNGFTLSGRKPLVAFCATADLLLVAARLEGRVVLVRVAPDAAGVRRGEPHTLVDSSKAVDIEFDAVALDGDAVLDGDAADAALTALRVGVAAEQLGLALEAFDRTATYLRERRQFGQTIGSFQGLQHRAAHLYAELEITRAAVLKALQLLDAEAPDAARYVHVAKARAGNTGLLAVGEGVQMFGGVGMTDEYDIGLFMKRDRALSELGGDAGFHVEQLARLHGY